MAKATIIPAVTKTETKVVEVVPERITLEVSRVEAEFLGTLVGRTGTDLNRLNFDPKLDTFDLYVAFHDAGLTRDGYEVVARENGGTGALVSGMGNLHLRSRP